MPTFETALVDNKQAYERFVAAVKRVPPGVWAKPVAPGKWTPAQVAEHIAIAFDIAARALKGESGIPRMFHPSRTSAPLTETLDRLARRSAGLDAAVAGLRQTGATTIEHPVFGTIPVEEYLELNAIHTRRHMAQLPANGAAAAIA